MRQLRLALLGAFNFPAPQGSQVYMADQAEALVRAGASVCAVCYRHGEGEMPVGVETFRIAGALSRRSYRSGFAPSKPAADLALALRLARVARERRIDAVLAHNAEAALVALLARVAPIVYVAHTLQEQELAAYGPAVLGGLLTGVGARIDRRVARGVDATIALGDGAARALAPHARGSIAVLPPGLETDEPPEAVEVEATCARHGVKAGHFVLYAGNLDGYQELDVLRDAATRLPERVFLVATHSAPRRDLAPLRVARVRPDAVRTLTHGAAVAVATRRRHGGFPIKLLNYMEAGRAIVAREGQATTLVDGDNARLLPEDARAEDFARAIEALLQAPERAEALGRAARETARREHDWATLARATLDLVATLPELRRTP